MGYNVFMYVYIFDDMSLNYMIQLRKIMKDGKGYIK